MSPRTRWWLPHVGIAVVQVGVTVVLAWTGQWLAALLALVIGWNILLARATQRHAFISGWCRGYADGVIDDAARRTGMTSPLAVRRQVSGSVVPEPWEQS